MHYEGPKVRDGLSVASLLIVEDLVVWEKNYCLLVGRVFEGWRSILELPT